MGLPLSEAERSFGIDALEFREVTELHINKGLVEDLLRDKVKVRLTEHARPAEG